jgi:hypothetical protein
MMEEIKRKQEEMGLIKKKDKAESYTIGFFGNLVSLKDKVKDDELTSLDFSDLNFTLTSTNIINKLKSTDPTEELICTLLSAMRQISFQIRISVSSLCQCTRIRSR